MATLNKVMLIGRLTDNPEAPRSLPSGGTVIKFRFAVGRSKKNPTTGQWENDPNPLYIDCEAFTNPNNKRDLVSLISSYAKKGDSLYLEGRLQLDQWEDKNGGGKRSKHKLVVEGIEFVGSKSEGGEGGGGGSGGGGGGGRSYSGGGQKPAGGGKPALPPASDDDEYGHGGGGGSGDEDRIPF